MNILRCVDYWREHTERMGYNKPITTFYPPWNKISDDVIEVCDGFAMELNDCVDESLVYNFHWWTFIGGRGLDKLEEKLMEDTNGSA